MTLTGPTLLSVTGPNAILTWSAVANVVGYVVKYGTTSGVYTTEITVGNVLTYEVTGLTNGITYYFRVIALVGVLLLEMDGGDGSTTFVDSSGYAHTMTPNSTAQLDTAQKYAGTASGLFADADDYVSTPSGGFPEFILEADDFEIGAQIRVTADPIDNEYVAIANHGEIIDPGGGNTAWVLFYGKEAGQPIGFSFYYSVNALVVDGNKGFRSNGAISLNVWHSIKIKRVNSVMTMYVDDVDVGGARPSNSSSDSIYPSTRSVVAGGWTQATNAKVAGWLDDVYINRRSAPSNELSLLIDLNPFDGSDLCPYVSGGEIREYVSTITGLHHLEGTEVSVVADGEYIGEKTVEDGTITLDVSAVIVQIGFKYRGIVIPMLLVVQDQLKNSISFGKNVSTIALLLAHTLGVKYGTSLYNLQDIPDEDLEQVAGDPLYPFTGVVSLPNDDSWEIDKEVICVQDEPYPAMLNAMNVTLEVGEK